MLNSTITIIDPLLFNAINRLTENQSEVILLFYFYGFNDREIAELNHMSVSGIWYQRQMAIKEMRRYLEEKHYE
ncbi:MULTISPECIES: sigma factor-like helix-turn-helix DNA-binding protein [unclassified Enterococcus]|uniref:RNA polymerase sigma factor n=1 Tax=unclassified Enterococcus TaxID=2608891 RepID=UPI00201B3F44|nr:MULTISPECIES: sigma factor-like helix-turn-helix DNA-binding protein [unclassified Enterococcus]